MIIIVFDFDDTIHPSSYVVRNNIDADNPIKLPDVSASVVELLFAAKQLADKVYIITNAEPGWVELCAKNHLPGCEEFFNQFHIISRDYDIATKYSFDQWKIHSFMKLASHFEDKEQIHHLISFGDLPYDRAAALNIRDTFPNVMVKNVLLSTSPRIETLLAQHNLMRNVMEYLVNHNTHLDLILTMTWNQPTSDTSTIQKSSEQESTTTTDSTLLLGKSELVSPISSSVSDMEDVFSLDP